MMLLFVLLLTCFPCVAFAEGLTAYQWPSVGTIVISACLIFLIVCFYLVWSKYLRAFFESLGLKLDADTVVRAAEAVVGPGLGDEKWKKALDWMEERGWNVEMDRVREAVKAAWQILDTEMRISGQKLNK